MAMGNQINLGQNKIFHLETLMEMYGIYNSYTLEKLPKTVYKMHNTTTWNEKLFASKLNDWYHWYLTKEGAHQFAYPKYDLIGSYLYFCSGWDYLPI